MNKNFLEGTGVVIALVGMVLGLGGLGMWLGRDYPFLVDNAGILGLVGLALVACGGGMMSAANPKPQPTED